MYQDAQEELKRLENALLEEDGQDDDISQWNIDDALSDIPDLPKVKKESRVNFWLTVTIIALTVGIVAVVVLWLIRYGSALL